MRSILRPAPLVLLLATACTVRDADSAHRADSLSAGASGASSSRRDTTGLPGSPPASAGSDAGEAVTVSPVGSQVEYYPASLLNHVADSLARGTTTGHMLNAHPTFQYLQIRRASSGVPEVHDRWIDVTTVQAGRGTLVYGGQVTGGALRSAGEHRGGVMQGAARRSVAPGDLMIIPAGVPHQYVLAPGDSLRYLTVKVAGGHP